MIPGPTPVPEKVLLALSKHPIGHRCKEFQDLVETTTKNLQWLHQTETDVLTITGRGTASMEAGIISNKFAYKTSLAKSEMHIAEVFSLIPTPDPAIILIGFVREVLLKENFSKETIVHISKFCVMSRSKPDFAKEIPSACELSLSKPTE